MVGPAGLRALLGRERRRCPLFLCVTCGMDHTTTTRRKLLCLATALFPKGEIIQISVDENALSSRFCHWLRAPPPCCVFLGSSGTTMSGSSCS